MSYDIGSLRQRAYLFGNQPQAGYGAQIPFGNEPLRPGGQYPRELDGSDVFYSVGEPMLTHREMNFEHHKRYIDIHVPVTGTERIALCPAASRPQDAAFDEEKDIGFFPGRKVNAVDVPAGWFCMCFPDDAHVPGMISAGESHAIVKVVVNVRA